MMILEMKKEKINYLVQSNQNITSYSNEVKNNNNSNNNTSNSFTRG